jgi:cation transport ATPase
MSNLSFSRINFNLYISRANNNTTDNYIYVVLPTDAANNAPLIKYKDDNYFVPYSVSCVKISAVNYIVIETRCEKTSEVFYLCIPITSGGNETNSVSQYLNAVSSEGSTLVNFDIQNVIIDYAAKISTVNTKYYTCVMNNPLAVKQVPSFSKDTDTAKLPFQYLGLPLQNDKPIQLQSGVLKAEMDCKRMNGDNTAEMETTLEEKPDQLINRMMTIVGFCVALLIAYSSFFDVLVVRFIIELMTKNNHLFDGTSKYKISLVFMYFGIMTVLVGLCFIIYSFVQPNAKRHLWIGFMFFALVALTQMLYKNLAKRSDFDYKDDNYDISHLRDKRPIWFGTLVVCLLALISITFASFQADFFLADSSAVFVYLLAIAVYCIPGTNDTGSNATDINISGRFWIRFIITAAAMVAVTISIFVVHAKPSSKL